jgi:aspartate racemase
MRATVVKAARLYGELSADRQLGQAGLMRPYPCPSTSIEVRLEAMGAQIIATPCNTAHAFLPRVRESIRVQMIDMIDETVSEIRRAHPGVRTAGILASDGTLQAGGLYHRRLERAALRVLVPVESVQHSHVTAAIHQVKASETGRACREFIASAARSLAQRGAQAVVAGCTEFPLVLDEASAGLLVIDPGPRQS